jgi:hypothetical protein
MSRDTSDNGTRGFGTLDSELVLAQLRRLEDVVADARKPPAAFHAWLALGLALLTLAGSIFAAGVAWSRVDRAEAAIQRLEALVARVEAQAAANRSLLDRLDERSRRPVTP